MSRKEEVSDAFGIPFHTDITMTTMGQMTSTLLVIVIFALYYRTGNWVFRQRLLLCIVGKFTRRGGQFVVRGISNPAVQRDMWCLSPSFLFSLVDSCSRLWIPVLIGEILFSLADSSSPWWIPVLLDGFLFSVVG